MTAKTPDTFLFVPQRPSGSHRDNRRFINTHLSHLAAQGRIRRGTTSASPQKSPKRPSPLPAKASAKCPIPRLPPRTLPSPDPSPEIFEIIRREPPQPPSDESSSSETESVDTPPDPLTLLGNGNHDPFDSTLIPLTPETHKLLLFDQDMFHPMVSSIEKGANKERAFSNKFGQTSLESLSDKCTGYANLARLAMSAAIVTSDQQMTLVGMNCKARAYESLRESISKHGVCPDEHLLTQIFGLLSLEVCSQQHAHAALHANTLQQLIQNGYENGIDPATMSRTLLSSVLWHECLRGSFTLCRPSFDIEQLIDHTPILRTLVAAKSRLITLGFMPPRIADGFQQAGIRVPLLIRLREFRFLADLGLALQQIPEMVDEEIMTAFTFRATLTSSKLLEIYNDVRDEVRGRRSDSDLTVAYMESATALGARYWYRAATSHEAVDVPASARTQMYQVFGTQKPVLRHLREAFEYCKQSGGVARQPQLWLWILHVATLAERADLHPRWEPEELLASSRSLHVAFAEQAKTVGIRHWDGVKGVLSRFLYSGTVGSRSRFWFERAMRREVGDREGMAHSTHEEWITG